MGESSTLQSLSRGLQLLDIIAQQPPGVTVKWLSATANLPISTCYHLIKTLVDEGYVEKDKSTQFYKLSYKIAYLHNQLRLGGTIPDSIKRISQEIVDRLKETTYIAKWDHDEVIIQHIAEGNQAVKVRTLYVGYREHAFMHALGKAILANVPTQEVQHYGRLHPPQPRTPHSLETLADIMADLRITRNRGYSRDEEEWEQGVCCIGAPIFQYDGSIWGAVAISMPNNRYDASDLATVQYIQHQAEAISAYLGYPTSAGERRLGSR
jgi:DNA-binding IclR family transcriptional regulator